MTKTILTLTLISFTLLTAKSQGWQQCQPSNCSYGVLGSANCHRFALNYMEDGLNIDPSSLACTSLTSSQSTQLTAACQGGVYSNWAGMYNTYFTEVSSLSEADVVAYERNNEVTHSAVVLRGTWPVVLLSKWESWGNLVKHDLYQIPDDYYTCNSGDEISYWRYNGSGGTPTCTPSSVSVQGSHNRHKSGSNCYTTSLYTFNQVCTGQISVTLNTISGVSYQWTRTGGSASYYVYNNGKNANIYLYSGTVSFSIQPLNSCNNPINTPRSVVFSADSGGGPIFAQPSNESYRVEIRNMSGELLETKTLNTTREELDKALTFPSSGLFVVHIYDQDNRLIESKKYYKLNH